MGDTEQKRKVRGILSDRLDSYYEALMEKARRDSRQRWEQVIKQAERSPNIVHAR